MGTVRDILAEHHSGISRPGLLAWSRLRIDPAMTDEQLGEELARLGDQVVDIEGWLYLRSNRPAARPPKAATRPGWSRWTSEAEGPPGAAQPGATGVGTTPSDGRRWAPARSKRSGCGSAVVVVGLVYAVLSVLGTIGDLGGGATPDSTPVSSATATRAPTDAATVPPGTPVLWTDLAVGDCFTWSEAGGGSLGRLPCDQPHGFEMFEVLRHPATDFPGETVFEAYAEQVCPRAFQAYTGTAVGGQDELTWYWWAPDEREWAAGVRTVECMLARADGSPADRSYRSGF